MRLLENVRHIPPTYPNLYLFRSRFLTHSLFWCAYYVLFSLIWAKPQSGYFASFYLEFVLMPARIFAVYCMLYLLIPSYLEQRRYKVFFSGYGVLVLAVGLVQMLISYFFFTRLMPELQTEFSLSVQSWIRNVILVNTTVLLLGTAKVFQMYIRLKEVMEKQSNLTPPPEYIQVKADRKIHRLKINDILYVEGMGNYVTYHLQNGQKKMVYGSLKDTQDSLPDDFMRIHRSYLVNKTHIESYSTDHVSIGGQTIPRGKDVTDEQLIA